jgi:hypothetical protein
MRRTSWIATTRVVDTHNFNADPDTALYYNSDPDLVSQNNRRPIQDPQTWAATPHLTMHSG